MYSNSVCAVIEALVLTQLACECGDIVLALVLAVSSSLRVLVHITAGSWWTSGTQFVLCYTPVLLKGKRPDYLHYSSTLILHVCAGSSAGVVRDVGRTVAGAFRNMYFPRLPSVGPACAAGNACSCSLSLHGYVRMGQRDKIM